jgi:hypothetical protein
MDEPNRIILDKMETSYNASIVMNQSWWSEADTDMRFLTGDQTVWSDFYGNVPAGRRRFFTFNHIRTIVNQVSGYQRRNRKSTIVTGVENADNETADQLTKVLMFINDREQVGETISEAFERSLATGLTMLYTYIDYRNDPVSGDVKVELCPYSSFIIDPFYKKPDLTDCNFIWRRSYLTKREILSLLPGKEEEIMPLVANNQIRDAKFQFMAEGYSYAMRNLFTYDEYYYRDLRPQKLLVDAETGETQEWRSDDTDKLKAFLKMYPQITLVENEVNTVRLAICVQGKILFDAPQPGGLDDYPFVPCYCHYYPELPYYDYRIQGLVRGLRDAQYLFNRKMIIQADILESMPNSGWIFKEDSVVNPKDLLNVGQGRIIPMKQDSNIQTDIQQIVPPQIPPSMNELTQQLAQELMKISGVNEELLGMATDEKAGILSMLRQGAGLTTLQTVFDHLDMTQKLLGRRMLELVQLNYTPGKFKKILQAEPTKQINDRAFAKYDCVVEEGVNTTTQKQMAYVQLTNLKEMGVPIPDEVLIEAACIQDKKKLTDAIMKTQQQAQQMQQQQAQLQMHQMAAEIELAQARASADRGLGRERDSRIAENQAFAQERRAASEKDNAAATLDMIKSLKEIEGTDLAHLQMLLNMLQSLKEAESAVNPKEAVSSAVPPSTPPAEGTAPALNKELAPS